MNSAFTSEPIGLSDMVQEHVPGAKLDRYHANEVGMNSFSKIFSINKISF